MTKQGKRVPTYTAVALTPSGEWQTELPDDATDVVAVVRARTGRGLTEQIISASELAAAAANKISIEVAQPELQHYRKTLQSRLKGMALDAAGQPIAYLPIVVYAQEMQLPLFFTTTDSDGRFAIELTKEMPEQIVIATLDERNAIVLNLADIYANANKILLFKIATRQTFDTPNFLPLETDTHVYDTEAETTLEKVRKDTTNNILNNYYQAIDNDYDNLYQGHRSIAAVSLGIIFKHIINL